MELLHKYGYSLVFLNIFLEQIGFPIPAAPILILAGAFAASGMLSFPVALICAAVGCVLADLFWFYVGRQKGRGVLKILCRLSLNPDSCVRKTESSFLRHGMNSLLFAKFVPGLNTIATPIAGMTGSNFFSFLWREIIGTLLYCTAYLFAGFLFEKRVFEITEFLESIGRSFLILILSAIALYVILKIARLKSLQKKLYKERITPEDLYGRIQAGEFLTLVDLRSDMNESGLKLPGALQIHPDNIDAFVSRLDRDKWIVMYCT